MCKDKYVNPFTDFGFKLLFGTPANKEFLIMILNSLFDEREQIVDISYNNTEIFGKSPDDRKAVYDLYCETADGSHIIVEMQNAYQRFFMDRTIYYSSFPIQAAAKKGDWDYKLPRVYIVAFLNFCMSDYIDSPSYKHTIRLADVDTRQVFSDRLTYMYIEMPKFNKSEDELHGFADCWLFALKNLALLDKMPDRLRSRIFERFFHEAEIANFTPEQRLAYEVSLKNMLDYNNTIKSAEEKGMEKGMEKGIAAVAKRMLDSGEQVDRIVAFTGLTPKEINEL